MQMMDVSRFKNGLTLYRTGGVCLHTLMVCVWQTQELRKRDSCSGACGWQTVFLAGMLACLLPPKICPCVGNEITPGFCVCICATELVSLSLCMVLTGSACSFQFGWLVYYIAFALVCYTIDDDLVKEYCWIFKGCARSMKKKVFLIIM